MTSPPPMCGLWLGGSGYRIAITIFAVPSAEIGGLSAMGIRWTWRMDGTTAPTAGLI